MKGLFFLNHSSLRVSFRSLIVAKANLIKFIILINAKCYDRKSYRIPGVLLDLSPASSLLKHDSSLKTLAIKHQRLLPAGHYRSVSVSMDVKSSLWLKIVIESLKRELGLTSLNGPRVHGLTLSSRLVMETVVGVPLIFECNGKNISKHAAPMLLGT
ncbi:MAG: hypothetical protein ACTS73_02445 [Arsenophonus sp. NEOnobi-MAG3]